MQLAPAEEVTKNPVVAPILLVELVKNIVLVLDLL
jgi:hypothetical protein